MLSLRSAIAESGAAYFLTAVTDWEMRGILLCDRQVRSGNVSLATPWLCSVADERWDKRMKQSDERFEKNMPLGKETDWKGEWL